MRFDVACYAPQKLAFLVDRKELGALGEALTDLYARGDAVAITTLWERVGGVLEDAKQRAKWRVPRATLERLCADAVTMCAAHPEAREHIADGVARMHDAAPLGEELVVYADRWLTLERAFFPLRFMPASWASIFVRALDALFTTPERRNPSPAGDLSFVARALREPDGHVRFVSMGEEVVDSVWMFADEVLQHAHVEELLEALVGPFEQSRGAGPFLPLPSSARPIVDPRALLPVFESGPRAHVLADAPSLVAALDEVLAARAPVKPWAGDAELHAWSPADPPWNVPWSTIATQWEPHRDRLAALLAEARDTERAVIFIDADVNDMGPGSAVPVDASWGHVTAS